MYCLNVISFYLLKNVFMFMIIDRFCTKAKKCKFRILRLPHNFQHCFYFFFVFSLILTQKFNEKEEMYIPYSKLLHGQWEKLILRTQCIEVYIPLLHLWGSSV